MWRKGHNGEKVENQVQQDHCCDNVAHQKSHQPIARDGKVGVSRLQEEDHHQCHNTACDSVQDHCCDNVAHQKSHQPIARDGKVGVSRLQEEDHHQCHNTACDSVHHQCNDAACDSVFEKV
jgi:hypothetical protein